MRRIAVAVAMLLFGQGALAGPPLLCERFEIGGAKSLPFGERGWRDATADYDVGRLVSDTLALLGPRTPVIVRMETLRRATVYAAKDHAAARDLLARLQARVKESEQGGRIEGRAERAAALALFDEGYLIESYKQAAWALDGFSNPAGGMNGSEIVRKAIALAGGDAEMEFASAIIACDHDRGEHGRHLRQALAGAREGSPLAENIRHHLARDGMSLADLGVKSAVR